MARARSGRVEVQTSWDVVLTMPEIVASVRSLYADGLKPFGRVLLKRLRERAAVRQAQSQGLPVDAIDPDTLPRVNPKHLRRRCETCRQLVLTREEGREYSVTLVGQPCEFLDVCSPDDAYPEEFWEQVAAYLDSVKPDEMMMPGGRYACARLLASRRLPCLEHYSLGEICHIVQLAINKRRLLGYCEGWLVPFKYSESWVKEQCAYAQSPTGRESFPVVSWEDARVCLRQLLSSLQEPGGITISNLKRLFRLNFQLELSETVLGHVRLLDLLNDPRLQDICTVHVQGSGHVTVRGVEMQFRQQYCLPPPTPPGVWPNIPMFPMLPLLPSLAVESNLTSHELLSPGASPRASPRAPPCAGFPCMDDSCRDNISIDSTNDASSESDSDDSEVSTQSQWSVSVKNTFIDVPVQDPKFLFAGSRSRRRSVPAAFMGLRRTN